MPRYSFYSFIGGSLLILATAFFYYPRWEKPNTEATISWDVSGYYMYLPSALIYHDLKKVAFFPEIEKKYNPGPGMGQAFKHEASGNYVMKYSCGQAFQFLPWFTVANAVAEPLGYPADGFSRPYQVAIGLGSLLIAILGLWFARKNLLEYFSDKATALALLGMVAGSNYLNYTAIDGAMTHNWLFTLYALLVWTTIQFNKRPTWARACVIGLLCGWAALTRPTEAISILIPLLWGGWEGRLAFLWREKSKIILAGVVFAAVGSIQLLYWKWATGDWVVYSYQDQGFSWLHPHLKEVLFSFRAGWLPYSPMMILGVVGLVPFWKQHRALFLPVVLFLVLFLYIAAAWDIWWYGGSLGARAMVQSYALWLFPMAAFAEWMLKRLWTLVLFAGLGLFFIWHSLWWTHQAHKGGLFVAEQMTKYFFLKVYGKKELERDWLKLLDNKDEFRVKSTAEFQQIYTNDFENDTIGTVTENAISGTRSLRLNAAQQFSPNYVIPLTPGEEGWIRASFTFRSMPKEWEWWTMTQAVVRFSNGDQSIKERCIRLQRHCDGDEPRRIYMDVQIPDKPFTKAELFFWNAGSNKTVLVDDLYLDLSRLRSITGAQ